MGRLSIINEWSKLGVGLFCTVLSGMSFALAVVKDDFIDTFIGGALSYIEEIITGISTVYSSILLGKAIGEVMGG